MLNKLSPARFFVWLTESQHNLKSFSVLRIIYGVALLFLLVPSIPERSMLWGEASFWVDPEASRRGYWTFDTILTKDSAILFDLAYFGLIALIIVFILGWRTRIITPIMLLMLIALHSNNNFLLNGGDTLIRITLLFMVFTNLSEYYSLDARRRRSTERRNRLVPAHVSNAAHNTGLILSCFQIIVVYTTSGVWKIIGDDWLNGTALFYALRIDNFMIYPAISELLWQSSLLIYVATFLALWVQTLFPLLILWRPTRIFALVSLIFMHLGIGVLMGLWPFSLAMIALDMLFIRNSTWSAISTWCRSTKFYMRVLEGWHSVKNSSMNRPAKVQDSDTQAGAN